MQFQGTPFEDYVLDEFIKVQLLFDDSYKYVKVSQISGIPTTPTLSSNSKSLFHKSSSLMKHLMELLNELSNVREIALSTEFKNNVTKFIHFTKLTLGISRQSPSYQVSKSISPRLSTFKI